MKAFKHLSSYLVAFALMGVASVASSAEDRYPSRPIRLVVPWPAGGTVDIVGRFLAERMTERLKTTVVVENKPGATGQIGSQAVANAAPDGYTLLIMSATVHTVSPNLAKSFPFDPVASFSLISELVSFPYVMVVSAKSPYNSVADLVKDARQNPGKVSYGSFGIGSGPFLISELFASTTGTQLLHVPYKGAGPALTDLNAGEISFFIDSLPSPLGQIRGGKLRALSVTTKERSATVPDVPTMGETIAGFEAIAWIGLCAPAHTPPEIIDALHKAVVEISAEPAYGARLRDIGLEPAASQSPAQFKAFVVDQKQYWADFIRKANIPLAD